MEQSVIHRLEQTGPGFQAERDREIAASIRRAVADLNAALEAAVRAGLIVEPVFSVQASRPDDTISNGAMHVATVRVFRRLC